MGEKPNQPFQLSFKSSLTFNRLSFLVILVMLGAALYVFR